MPSTGLPFHRYPFNNSHFMKSNCVDKLLFDLPVNFANAANACLRPNPGSHCINPYPPVPPSSVVLGSHPDS